MEKAGCGGSCLSSQLQCFAQNRRITLQNILCKKASPYLKNQSEKKGLEAYLKR
jgi:hypothetical protein